MSPAPDDGTDFVPESPLHRALRGDIGVGEDLYLSSFEHLLRLARRRARALPPDVQREIPGETWALVYSRGVEALDASSAPDDAYLAQVHRNAVEAVQANYRPPLARSRRRRQRTSPLTENEMKHRRRPMVKVPADDVELCPDPSAEPYDAIDARIDLERRMASMEPQVAHAVRLIENQGVTISEAARVTGLTRQTLGRRLQELALAA